MPLMHLEQKHGITENSPVPKSLRKPETFRPPPLRDEEQTSGGSVILQACSSAKKGKQSRIETLVVARHSLKADMLHMICVSNASLHQAYPDESSPPKSIATLRNIVEGEKH